MVPEVEAGRFSPGKFDRVANFVAKARSRNSLLSLNTGYQRDLLGPAPASGESGPTGELVPLQRHLSVKKKQLIRGALLGACLTAAAIVGALKYSGYRHRADEPAQTRAQVPTVKSDTQTATPVSQPESAAPSAAGDVFNPGKKSQGTPLKSTPTKQIAALYAHAQSQTQTLETKRAKQSALLPDELQGSGTRSASKKQMTPAQLWAAVQAGNSKAAVTLAELYIKGEGVPQNCQQARVLLLVASEKRNEAAIKRLQALDKDKDACP
jgi:hypothetical protein